MKDTYNNLTYDMKLMLDKYGFNKNEDESQGNWSIQRRASTQSKKLNLKQIQQGFLFLSKVKQDAERELPES